VPSQGKAGGGEVHAVAIGEQDGRSTQLANALAQLTTKTPRATALPQSKGRHSQDERDSERRAQELLRASSPPWSVSASTRFEDLECLISALVKR
jgi:hypothetical protein